MLQRRGIVLSTELMARSLIRNVRSSSMVFLSVPLHRSEALWFSVDANKKVGAKHGKDRIWLERTASRRRHVQMFGGSFPVKSRVETAR